MDSWIHPQYCEHAILSLGFRQVEGTRTEAEYRFVEGILLIGTNTTSIGKFYFRSNPVEERINQPQNKLRFVDRDMMMRYHPGLAIGHTYYHEPDSTASLSHSSHDRDSHELDEHSGAENGNSDNPASQSAVDSDVSMDSMDGAWEDDRDTSDSQHSGQGEFSGAEEDFEDEENLALYEMYELE